MNPETNITDVEPIEWPSDLNYLGPGVCIGISILNSFSSITGARSIGEFTGAAIAAAIPVIFGFIFAEWAKKRPNARFYWSWFFALGWIGSIIVVVMIVLVLFAVVMAALNRH